MCSLLKLQNTTFILVIFINCIKLQHLFQLQSHYLHYLYSVITIYNIILWYCCMVEVSCGLICMDLSCLMNQKFMKSDNSSGLMLKE